MLNMATGGITVRSSYSGASSNTVMGPYMGLFTSIYGCYGTLILAYSIRFIKETCSSLKRGIMDYRRMNRFVNNELFLYKP